MELLCRLCGDLKSEDQIKCTIRDKSLEIERKLIDCCRWHLYQDSEYLPENVCHSCFECLQRSWEFSEAVATAQQKLNEKLNNSVVKLESPDNVIVDDDKNDGLFDDLEPMNEVSMNDNWDNWFNDDSSEDDFETKIEPLAVESLPQIKIDVNSILEEQRTPIVLVERLAESITIKEPNVSDCFEPNGNGAYEDETLENYTKYKINFLDSLMPDERNPDGTVKEEAISRLKLTNWTSFQNICNECNLTFIDLLGLTRHHKKEHFHLPIRYKCWLCKDSTETIIYRQRNRLVRHIIHHHIPYLAYCCKTCNKYYWDLEMLKKHRPLRTCSIGETEKVPVICEHCGDSFLNENNLRQHKNTRHIPDELRQIYECYLCRAMFRSVSGMKLHVRKHAASKLFECTICHRKFDRRFQLKYHSKIHFDEMPFDCSYCGKKFRYMKRLKIHERIHTDERRFKCKVQDCDYSCTDSGNIYKHMKQKHKMIFGK